MLTLLQSKKLPPASASIVCINSIGAAEEDDRASVEVSHPIMYPERLDRPGDVGWLNGVPVPHVTRGPHGHIRHHAEDGHREFRLGQQVDMVVDYDRRAANAARLGAGWLVEVIGKAAFADLHPIGASYWPNRSWVEFGATDYLPDPTTVESRFSRELQCALGSELRLAVVPDESSEFAQVYIGDFPPFVSAGPFPGSIAEIGGVIITRIVAIRGRIQVRFRAGQADADRRWVEKAMQ